MSIVVFGEAEQKLHIAFDAESQEVHIESRDESGNSVPPVHAVTAISYQREKGPKILTQWETSLTRGSSVADAVVSPDARLEQYSHVWAIDTNTKERNGYRISATVVTACSTDGSGSFAPVLGIYFACPRSISNPECVGWHAFLQFLVNNDLLLDGAHCGLVVDSELGRLPGINAREIPFVHHWRLPRQVELIYASDSVASTLFNKLIKECHKVAQHMIRGVQPTDANSQFFAPTDTIEDTKYSYYALQPKPG